MAFNCKRVLGVVVAMGVVAGSTARAQEAAAAPTAAGSVDVVSAYVFRGGTVNDEVNVQPTVKGTFNGLTLGTWGTLNTDSSQFEEIDLTASYALPTGKCPLGLAVGYTEYTYPAAEHVHPGGLAAGETSEAVEADREVSVVASHTAHPCEKSTLSTSVSGNFGIEGPFLDEGIYVEGVSTLSIKTCEKSSISAGVTVGAELGDNYENNGISHVDLDAGLSYAFLSVGVKYVIETDDDVLTVDEDVVGKATITLPL